MYYVVECYEIFVVYVVVNNYFCCFSIFNINVNKEGVCVVFVCVFFKCVEWDVICVDDLVNE